MTYRPASILSRRGRWGASSRPPWNSTEPVREELLGVERLEEQARALAAAQPVTAALVRGRSLHGRLADNERVLLEAYRDTCRAVDDGAAITPAAEWLIDNFHLVEKQIHEIRSDMPAGYYRQLPKLAGGPLAGLPRIFGIAWAFVAHTDSRFDVESLCRFVHAYQEVQPLTLGELWAAPITLRAVLVENLRRMSERIVGSRTARRAADSVADRLLGLGDLAGALLTDYERRPVADAFLVQLVHRLRDQTSGLTPVQAWLDQRLGRRGTTAEAVVRDEHQRQVAASVTVRNIITSMRLISDVDWTELVERMSLVDEVLSAAGDFKDMDFATRNLYRTAIERVARRSGREELDVARAAIGACGAARAAAGDIDGRHCDPGYHLIAGGQGAFEAAMGYRPSIQERLARFQRRLGIGGYVIAGLLAAAVLLFPALCALDLLGVGRSWLIIFGVLGAAPAVDAAVAIVNRLMAGAFGPTLLPALELRTGVPSRLRTLVAAPSMLTTPQAVDELVEALEIHHLASLEGDLHFALVTDWTDSPTEHGEGDEALLAHAIQGVAELNRRYGPAPGGDRFLLLHRRRVWNEGEGRWIGWERKRGKLHELNRLLRGAVDTNFMPLDGKAPAVPAGVRYVITLDSDTRLPRDTVRRLIGKMAHPLNRPRLDTAHKRVVEGYGVLQPRVTSSLPTGSEGSLFQRVFSSASGIDPYAAAVSDVYQDLLGEGSYAGKGIYDVDAFEAAMAGRVPDSTLLSHDLFEGIFARAGLASDVEVLEEFPARYDVAAVRHHRWVRGDWQLLPWIFGWGRLLELRQTPPPTPASGRWKMIDNLRRSLSSPAALVALVAGWTLPPGAAAAWTAFVLLTVATPALIPVFAELSRRRDGVSTLDHLGDVGAELGSALAQAGLLVVLLAHQAWIMVDAILRTLWRMFVTRRHLLEWIPAAQASISRRLDLASFYARMAGALVIAALAVAVAWASGSGSWPMAALFAVAWAASPASARWLSLTPSQDRRRRVMASDAKALRLIARRTWRFFETFVTAVDHMLPPDNFQETPSPVVAHRTSPTNIGLYLMSTACACEFGWIGIADAVGRLESTHATLLGMARFRGHFYNWYDTTTLAPLEPRYVSSVDSGNLAGHLIALANTCRDWRRASPGGAARLAGVEDALEMLRQEAGRLRHGRRTQTVTWAQLDEALSGLADAVGRARADPGRLTDRIDGLTHQADQLADIVRALAGEGGEAWGAELVAWAEAAHRALGSHRRDLDPATDGAELDRRLSTMERASRSMALEMEFDFLLDRERMLLSIGYVAAEGVLDPSCYDLLASEARLASFFAIAKGDVPARHWFRLSHAVTRVPHGAALISWSGSMFEYLMPSLVMRAPPSSLIERTNRVIVRRQIEYGDRLRTPWGVSESAYNARDLELTYQYSNFGVPGLGLKRGLGENAVIAPYATALAAMVDSRAATRNFERLAGTGALGRYGFYEALDYTPARVPEGAAVAIVQAFMAHHQGMTVVAIADALLDGLMRTRFHAEPMVQANDLLLQERAPRHVPVTPSWAAHSKTPVRIREAEPFGGRRFADPNSAMPTTHLLSNGRYSVMLTGAGSGYSRWRDMAVTRWREDPTCDDLGSYVFLRNVASGEVWSAGFQPIGSAAEAYEAAFTEDRAEFSRRNGAISTMLEVLVSEEDDAEVRRVTIANAGLRPVEIEITSFAELVLAPQAADVAHPAFSKLFIHTEHLAGPDALLATRRRRSPSEPEIWAGHVAVVEGAATAKTEFETDRARFIGRARDLRTAGALSNAQPLSGSVGAVLDPIFALRRRIRVEPGAIARVAFWTMVAGSRREILDMVDKHRDATAFDRVATLAWTQAQVELQHLGVDRSEAALFQRLAGHVVYAGQAMRSAVETSSRRGAQPDLWPLGVSGDLPIVFLRIGDMEHIDVARQLLRAWDYWRLKRLSVDVVILNDRASSYVQDLQGALDGLVRTSQARPPEGHELPAGQVFVLRADLVSQDLQDLLARTARVVLTAERGRIADQLDWAAETHVAPRTQRPTERSGAGPPAPARAPLELERHNGLGGFAAGGSEYVTVLEPGQTTPAPWINVIANPDFGFHVSAEGAGYSWSANSRERQLTPWSNDPVCDRPGEAFYLRDDETGEIWTPTAQPIRDPAATYVARHGWGYSAFELVAAEIETELRQYVPTADPIKISRLTIRNRSRRRRRISVCFYAEWVLGPSRAASSQFVTTELDEATGALFARNPWNADFATRTAFLDLNGRQTSWTGDRREFIGRNGSLADPAALAGGPVLSKTCGAGLDPCGAVQCTVELAPYGETEVVAFLGDAPNPAQARELVSYYRAADLDAVLTEVRAHWQELLGAIQVRTPDRALDLMLNGWLLYQTLACRIWARSGFYQASGAYGFRDQLQDGMALAALRPAETRQHLLRAMGRQFPEGDVQHWWLPHSGQGVRTRISDDRVWLAYAADHFAGVTGDQAVFDETAPFLEGPGLETGEAERFFQPAVGVGQASLYEHCARGLDRSLELGGHGLPLIGGGDWNDGMNRVGERGHGESVWLGWLLFATLTAFIPRAESRGDGARAKSWRAHAAALKVAVEKQGWDGDWYRRAWFDDGTPLGSAANEECRIDSIAQSWAVLSGAAKPERAARAMAAVERELVLPDEKLALLFKPPFDRTPLEPGYIKAYPPGVRENGGQYTHAALWSVMAFAALGEGGKAVGLMSLLNPINHARTRADTHRYKVEPYAVAADIYSVEPHVGRGGWTWYTGSAAWMHRAGVESILGLRRQGQSLLIDPCIPKDWPGFEATLVQGAARYHIRVDNAAGVCRGVASADMDGAGIPSRPVRIAMTDDGAVHEVLVKLG